MISKNRHAHGRTAAAAVLGSLLLVLDVTTLGAVSSQTWRQRELADFENAQLHGVSLSADGTIRLAPPLDLLYEADEPYIWALAEGADGAIYAAGGNDGAIYRIAPSGEGEVYFHVEEPQVQAMVVGPDGDLFVGTAPGGRIYKISPDGGQGICSPAPETKGGC
jgi:hypothetical protein